MKIGTQMESIDENVLQSSASLFDDDDDGVVGDNNRKELSIKMIKPKYFAVRSVSPTLKRNLETPVKVPIYSNSTQGYQGVQQEDIANAYYLHSSAEKVRPGGATTSAARSVASSGKQSSLSKLLYGSDNRK